MMNTSSRPETLKARLSVLAILGLAALAGLGLTACASVNRNPATVMSAYADDFNSGSPGAKNLWDQVVATVNSGDYATALATLEQLQTEDGLPPAKAGDSGSGSRGKETTAQFGKNSRAKQVILSAAG